MKLLITTQAVDLDDPILGFFHRWIQEFAKQCESIEVICLREGRHALPTNVHVHSLGKENGVSRVAYVFRFYRYISNLRNQYDSVFVHMNQEYVLLGGKFWLLWGKRVILWRNHKKGSILTRVAASLSHTVCYTSRAAYVAGFKNAARMPIGIDTKLFATREKVSDASSILFLGRLDAVKHPDIFLEALGVLEREGVKFHADIYGDPTPGREEYAKKLRERHGNINGVSFHSAVRNDQTPAIYSGHAIYVNLTPSGSFDKTIGEALASGCIVVAGNEELRNVLPDELLVEPSSVESVARGIEKALRMDEASRERLLASAREYVEREHSLSLLASKLAALYKT